MKNFSLGSNIDDFPSYILCFYINITCQVQIIKITNIPNYYWERAIFPGQQLIFAAMTSALLEIHTSESVTPIPSDIIPCQDLLLVTAYSYWTRKNVLNELFGGGFPYSCREIEAVLEQVLNELPDNYNTFTEKDSRFCIKLSW